jgi:hypothetical protein
MGSFYLMNKRGQAWSLDLLIGAFLFTVALSVFYFSILNSSNNLNEAIDLLSYDGRSISKNILSEGSPSDWSSSNVIQIGVLDNGKISETKLEAFYDLANADYARTKLLFNTRYDYYFFLDANITFNSTIVDGIGKPGITRDNVSQVDIKNLIRVDRISVYENKIMGATLFVWEND